MFGRNNILVPFLGEMCGKTRVFDNAYSGIFFCPVPRGGGDDDARLIKFHISIFCVGLFGGNERLPVVRRKWKSFLPIFLLPCRGGGGVHCVRYYPILFICLVTYGLRRDLLK